ncbi:MAG: DNA-binding response OmpR family regulator [Bacteriovoracaceae bacterium]|jgi:DNA-binding response OmpR family regulator
MNSKEKDLLYLSSGSKIIHLIDEDTDLLKKLGNITANAFLDYDIIAMTSIEDSLEEIQEKKPTVIVCSLDFQDGSNIFELIKLLKAKEVTKKIPVIVTGTRGRLEEEAELIKKYKLQVVPKSIRIPHLLGTISAAINEANSINFDVVNLKAGEVLFREGDRSTSIYVLKTGKLAIIKENESGRSQIAELSGRQLVGEMAFLNGEIRSATVEAIVDTEVIELKLGDPESFIREQPFWLGMMLETLVRRLKEMDKKLSELS